MSKLLSSCILVTQNMSFIFKRTLQPRVLSPSYKCKTLQKLFDIRTKKIKMTLHSKCSHYIVAIWLNSLDYSPSRPYLCKTIFAMLYSCKRETTKYAQESSAYDDLGICFLSLTNANIANKRSQ